MSTVIDVDLSKYFDTIGHSMLLDKIAKRILSQATFNPSERPPASPQMELTLGWDG